MITIPVHSCGDVWCDPEEFCTALRKTDPQQSLMLDLKAEGPSLGALGVLDELRNYCHDTGRDPGSIRLINSPNNIEKTEFENTHRGRSHFFSISAHYWQPAVRAYPGAKRLAMLVGRTTVARCSMMFELYHDPDLSPYFKFSTMDYDGLPIWNPYTGWRVIERFDQWLSADSFDRMTHWWQTARPPSVDQKKVQDQYDQDQNTNRSILVHYGGFHMELIAETHTLGETFFPTEKTVRPIMAAKPFIIYAAPGFLERLRDLGFRTFHDFWNEDYDLYQGPERWHHIKAVIKHLCAMDDADFNDLMKSAQVVAAHNRGLLADLVLTPNVHHLLKNISK